MYPYQLAYCAYPFLHTGDRQVKERFLFRWQRGQIGPGSCQGIIRQAIGLRLIDFRAIEGEHTPTQVGLVALEDDDLAEYAAGLGLDETRLIREVTASVYAPRIREDFKSGVRGGVNGTPTFFINGERYDGPLDLKHLLNAVTFQST